MQSDAVLTTNLSVVRTLCVHCEASEEKAGVVNLDRPRAHTADVSQATTKVGTPLELEFDAQKSWRNRAKRGIDFVEAQEL